MSKLTSTQKSKIENRLFGIKCPICGCTSMSPSEDTMQVVGFQINENSVDLGNIRFIDCLCVTCTKCGYVMQFSLDRLLK